jgi:dipeptidase D
MVDKPVESLEPKAVFSQFARILEIPRPSGHEEKIAQHVLEAAKRKGAAAERDAAGNVVVRVPATKGREKSPITVLQTHIDMVGEKRSDVAHDFTKDPIVPRLDGEWLYATGTTLGADNGIGVAAALALLENASGDLAHGPLELLFTVDEETGLTGAKKLSPKILKGKRLLNLDSEEDGLFFIGCSGGCDTKLALKPAPLPTPPGGDAFQLKVSGLKGGHSGIQIHENRGNALKILARWLLAAQRSGVALELARFEGGGKHNAIPREAAADVLLDAAAAKAFRSMTDSLKEALGNELDGIDDGLRLGVEPLPEKPKRIFRAADRDRFLRLVEALPHGVLAMSGAVPGLVETSSNVAVAHMEGDHVVVWTSSRSSVAPALEAVLARIRSMGELAGFAVETADGYPGWKPNPKSPLLETAQKVFTETRGEAAKVTAIHAGLECGLIGEIYPKMDMISFGPEIQSPHSPDERVNVESVARFWSYLKSLLAAL